MIADLYERSTMVDVIDNMTRVSTYHTGEQGLSTTSLCTVWCLGSGSAAMRSGKRI